MSPRQRLDQQRAEQLLKDAQLAAEIAKGYGGPWERMRAEILQVLAVVEKAKQAGETIDTRWLLRKGYLDRLEKVVTFQVRAFLDLTERKVKAASVQAALDGHRHADQLVKEVAPQAAPVPLAETAFAIQNLRAGAPLRLLLDTLPGQVGSQAASALLEGVLLGRGPREIARDMRKVAQVPLTRALTISRTETLRVYRQAAIERYRQASVLTGWVWTAKLDERTCPVCVALHGTVHQLDETMDTHPNCRCTMAPLTEPWRDGEIPETRFTPETGEAWFARQPENVQAAMLGPGKFALYQAGELQLADLVQPVTHPVWGRGVRERPLRELPVIAP